MDGKIGCLLYVCVGYLLKDCSDVDSFLEKYLKCLI